TEEPAPPKRERTFVVRTPDSSSSLKVTVPSTTAEAMAMNLSIRENARAKKEAAARRLAKQPAGEGAASAAAAAAAAPHSRGRPAERRRVPSMMVVTPNARSRSIQMEVPLTTAECIELNRAVKERYPTQQQEADEDNNGVNAGYSRRWRNPPAPGVGGGQGAHHAYGAGLSSSPEIVRYADVEQGAREPSYDRTIGNLHKARRWDQIVRVWE
ncbi:unnamed protein product, partial [Ectocarpus sp. 8 AP-2014]